MQAHIEFTEAVGSAIYLFFRVLGGLALLWPFLAGLISAPAQVGRLELALAKKIGYVDQEVRLGWFFLRIVDPKMGTVPLVP